MAALALSFQMFVDGVWTTYAGYSADGWSTRVGPDVQSGLQPNQINFVLQNDDLSMDPTYAASPLYGKIGRNTRTRIVVGGSVPTWAEASEWDPERTPEHVPGTGRGRSHVGITAEGLLRRLGRWEDPLDSPMRRQIMSYSSSVGYWPLEDPSGAATLAQMVSGYPIGAYTGTVTLGGDPGPGGSDPVLKMGSDGRVGARFQASAASGWQFSIACRLNANPASATWLPLFFVTDTLGRTYNWNVSNLGFAVDVIAADGSVLHLGAATGTGINLTQPFRCRLKVTVSGGTITYEPAWYAQDAATPAGITETYAGTATGSLRTWFALGNAHTTDAGYGHAMGVTDTSLDLIGVGTAARDAFNGYLGERAGTRFNRVLLELGITRYTGGDSNLSARMGRQRSATIMEILEEIVATDACLIYDEPLDIALTIRLNNDLINRTPALTIALGTEVAPPLRRITGDLGVVNSVVVKNSDGTELRLEKTTGSLSTAVPPDGVGRYRKTLDVSLADPNHLASRGNWDLTIGTLDRPRYAALSIDLLKFPALRGTVTAIRPGDIIAVTGAEPDTVLLRVMTIERKGGAVADTVTFSCLPADVWQTGAWNDGVSRRDSKTTVLKTGVAAGATSLTFRTTTFRDRWSTTSVPYDVMIAGERITVTAMGAAALVGGAYDQVATCTRSANGVSKAQLANAEIHIANPGRWALGRR